MIFRSPEYTKESINAHLTEMFYEGMDYGCFYFDGEEAEMQIISSSLNKIGYEVSWTLSVRQDSWLVTFAKKED